MLNSRIRLRPYYTLTSPEYIVYSDLDETFYCHNSSEEENLSIVEFEQFMVSIGKKKKVLFGIVTGSSLESVIKKLEKGHYQFSPHFIACDLGTMLYWVDSTGTISPDSDWSNRLKYSNFSDETVDNIVETLQTTHQIELVSQTQLGSSPFKKNYYYFMKEEKIDKQNLEIFKNIALHHDISCNINVCNPLAGDPEAAFDIDFIPKHTGKAEIVSFINEKFTIPKEKSYAFGDSGNDIAMLRSVGHGYLLQNATKEAKSLYKNIAAFPYTKGMRYILKEKLE